MSKSSERESLSPSPWEGSCTRRDHVCTTDEEQLVQRVFSPGDERLFRCDCGLVMMGHGRVEIRFGLLPHLFPEEPS